MSNTTVVDITGMSTTLSKNWTNPDVHLHNRDIDHVKKNCNYGTFAVFCRLNHPAAVVAQRRACATPVSTANVDHLVNELQLENLYDFLNRGTKGSASAPRQRCRRP